MERRWGWLQRVVEMYLQKATRLLHHMHSSLNTIKTNSKAAEGYLEKDGGESRGSKAFVPEVALKTAEYGANKRRGLQ